MFNTVLSLKNQEKLRRLNQRGILIFKQCPVVDKDNQVKNTFFSILSPLEIWISGKYIYSLETKSRYELITDKEGQSQQPVHLGASWKTGIWAKDYDRQSQTAVDLGTKFHVF